MSKASNHPDAEWLRSQGGKYQDLTGDYTFFSPKALGLGMKPTKMLWLDVNPIRGSASLSIMDKDDGYNSHWYVKKITRSRLIELCKALGIRIGPRAVRWLKVFEAKKK